jgi:hypothetical protein
MKNRLLIAVLLFVQPFLMTSRPVVLDQKQQLEVIQCHPTASQGLGVNLVSHLGGQVHTTLAQGHYVYAGFGLELAVLDLSQPGQPKLTGSALALGEVQDLDIVGHYLYLAYQYEDINGSAAISICKTGTFALAGPTHSFYLPVVR